MDRALGLVEYLKVPSGMIAADKMVKTADIKVIHAATVCPGKYIVLFKGSLSSVKSAIEAGTKAFEENVIDSFLLGNPTDQIYGAISGSNEVDIKGAIGIVESYSVASIIESADTAAKTSDVKLVEVRLARGMCGKSFFIIIGELAAVDMAIENSKKILKDKGMFLDSGIIPNPDKGFIDNLY
ncbi:BMC domain-containing protein [Clostridium carnis]